MGESFADRLRLVLEAKGWSAGEWSQKSGLAVSHVANLISRNSKRPAADTVTALAQSADVSFDWLMRGAGASGLTAQDPRPAVSDSTARTPTPTPVGAGESPLVHALGVAFDHTRHNVNDLRAVQDALTDGSFQWQRIEGDLVEAARTWLDAAAALRHEGQHVSTVAILYRVTIRNTARAREPDRADTAREASTAAESTSLGHPPRDTERSPSAEAPLPPVEESGPSGIRVISPGGSPAVPKTAKR